MDIQIDTIAHPQAKISLLRLDLIDKDISGNKWFKLFYNIKEAKRLGKSTILTFGGAFSNHIYATAAAAQKENLNSIGIIRGEETLPLNPTLAFAKSCGMKIEYISRSDYRQKETPEFLKSLKHKFSDPYIIPEGGSNGLAIKGIAEILKDASTRYDYYITPIGTGATMAGIISGLKGESYVLGFAALKGAEDLEKKIMNFISDYNRMPWTNWKIVHDYHFGGYAKFNELLYDFIKAFKQEYDILLDPIYTGKMMYGLFDLLNKGFFSKGCRILILHTGGLQGWTGMKMRYNFIDGSFPFN